MIPAAPLMEKLSSRRPRSSSLHMPNEDEKNAVHQYKQFMDEIKREHPDIGIGAQQKLALEQCANLNDEMIREQQTQTQTQAQTRFSLPEDLLQGMMSKLNIGSYVASFAAEDGEDGIGSMFGLSTQQASSNQRKETSIALHKSVIISKEIQNELDQIDSGEIDNDDSLQDSLDDIENYNATFEKSLDRHSSSRRPGRSMNNNSMKYSGKLSIISMLELVEEDEEESQETSILPGEILVHLDDFHKNINEEEVVTCTARANGHGRRGNSHLRSSNTSDDNNSSFNSDNFTGDFSAWRSIGSRG